MRFMKNVMVVLAAFILVLTVSSCGKESALWAERVPAIEQEAVANDDSAPLDFRRSADTTLQLTTERATLDTIANTYTITFDRDYTGDVQGLSAQQQLAFTDEHGKSSASGNATTVVHADEHGTGSGFRLWQRRPQRAGLEQYAGDCCGGDYLELGIVGETVSKRYCETVFFIVRYDLPSIAAAKASSHFRIYYREQRAVHVERLSKDGQLLESKRIPIYGGV
jgi:hypothetical protein